MGQGRKAKPTSVKKAQGVQPCRINENEPEYEIVLPECPDFLTDSAKIEWDRLGPILFEQGLITEVDKSAFAAYCQCYGRWQDAEAQLKEESLTIPGRYEGQTSANPLIGIAHTAYIDMSRMLVSFGMTPADRQKVTANLPKDKKKDNPKSRVAQKMSGNVIPINKVSNG